MLAEQLRLPSTWLSPYLLDAFGYCFASSWNLNATDPPLTQIIAGFIWQECL